MEMCKIIKQRRRELEMTLDDVAKAVGVNRSTVQRWESGAIFNIKRDKIAKLAFVLRVSPEYLLGWTEDPTRNIDDDLEAACVDLSNREREQLLNYILFLKSQRSGFNG